MLKRLRNSNQYYEKLSRLITVRGNVNTSVTKLCFTNFLFIVVKEPNSWAFITVDLFAWSKIAIFPFF